MGFEVPFREFNLNFDFGNIRVKAIDASHGAFIRSFPRHIHSFYELHYIIGGEGKLILDDEAYELSAGKLFLTAPKVYHAQQTNESNPMEEYCFSFEIKAKKTETQCELSDFFAASVFYICDDTHNLKAVFSELEEEINNRETGYITAVQSLLERILLFTVRNFTYKHSKTDDVRTVPDDRRSLIMDEAFLFSYRTLTLEKLAQLLNLSIRHTERLIYEKYNTSFVKMRMQSRLNAAVDMIENGDVKMLDIAENCGFSSYIHFLNAFKKEFGMPPSEYKKVHIINGGKHK